MDTGGLKELMVLEAMGWPIASGYVDGVLDVERIEYSSLGRGVVISHEANEFVVHEDVASRGGPAYHGYAQIGSALVHRMASGVEAHTYEVDITRQVIETEQFLEPRSGVVEVQRDPHRWACGRGHPASGPFGRPHGGTGHLADLGKMDCGRCEPYRPALGGRRARCPSGARPL